MKHKYFVSYSFKDLLGKTSTGNAVFEYLEEIKDMEDIENIQNHIIGNFTNVAEVTILNFIKIKTENKVTGEDMTLFLDFTEYKDKDIQIWLNENANIIKDINIDKDEKIVSCYISNKIKLEKILEISSILDENISICDRYFGSESTIRSLGL